MIKQGYLPNPDVQTRLAEAINFVGTCEELCPEFERHEREYQNNVDPLERVRCAGGRCMSQEADHTLFAVRRNEPNRP